MRIPCPRVLGGVRLRCVATPCLQGRWVVVLSWPGLLRLSGRPRVQLGWEVFPFHIGGRTLPLLVLRVPLASSRSHSAKFAGLPLCQGGGCCFARSVTRVLDFRASLRRGNSPLSGGARSRAPPRPHDRFVARRYSRNFVTRWKFQPHQL